MIFKKLIKNIAKILDEYKIPYLIIGGQALLIYGEPRLTKDIDITLGVGPEFLEKIIKIVEKLKLKILIKDPVNFVKETFVLPVIDNHYGIRIDFIFSVSEFEQNAIKRAKKVKINSYPVKFASIEDLIIFKMIAGRERDLEDVRVLLLKNQIDFEYVKKWLLKFQKIFDKDYLSLLENIKK